MSESAIGPYQTLADIGRGRLADIYEARDSRPGHQVALKVLLPELAANLGLGLWIACRQQDR